MNTNSDRDLDALTKRAITASLVASVVFGGMAAWHYVSPERTVEGVEQAQRTASRLGAKEPAALEREAARDASARAFAEKQAAEQQAQAEAEEHARAEAQRLYPPSHG